MPSPPVRELRFAAKSGLAPVEHVQRIPAPVDPVAMDQSALDFHHFHELHLVVPWRRARIFPHDHAAIAEETGPESLGLRRIALKNQGNEPAQLVLAPDDPLFRLHEMLDERTLDRGIVRIERQRCFQILLAQRIVPELLDPFGIVLVGLAGHGGFLWRA